MKKGLKKQVELELIDAINKALAKHSSKTNDKTTKIVKAAGKAVAKKFVKALKHTDTDKTSKKNNVVTPKVAFKKIASKRDKTGKFISLKPTNGVHKGTKKIVLHTSKKVSHRLRAPHHN